EFRRVLFRSSENADTISRVRYVAEVARTDSATVALAGMPKLERTASAETSGRAGIMSAEAPQDRIRVRAAGIPSAFVTSAATSAEVARTRSARSRAWRTTA